MTAQPGTPLSDPARKDRSQPAASVLDRMLGGSEDAPRSGTLADAVVATWTETMGTLADGRTVRLGASCLVLPSPDDRVLVWLAEDGERWILNVLERAGTKPTVISTPGPMTIQAERVSIAAQAVHVQAEDFLTSTRNRHAVEDVRTETVRTRVAQIGTDIRRASHVTDEVEGAVLQRAGMWLSNTLNEARLHAKAFLFD